MSSKRSVSVTVNLAFEVIKKNQHAKFILDITHQTRRLIGNMPVTISSFSKARKLSDCFGHCFRVEDTTQPVFRKIILQAFGSCTSKQSGSCRYRLWNGRRLVAGCPSFADMECVRVKRMIDFEVVQVCI